MQVVFCVFLVQENSIFWLVFPETIATVIFYRSPGTGWYLLQVLVFYLKVSDQDSLARID